MSRRLTFLRRPPGTERAVEVAGLQVENRGVRVSLVLVEPRQHVDPGGVHPVQHPQADIRLELMIGVHHQEPFAQEVIAEEIASRIVERQLGAVVVNPLPGSAQAFLIELAHLAPGPAELFEHRRQAAQVGDGP